MTDLLDFLDSRWSFYLGCTQGQLRDGGRHIVTRPEAASGAESPWPLRRGPIALLTTSHGWVMSLPAELCERARALCLGCDFEELVEEGDRLQQDWFDSLDQGPDTDAREQDRGDRGYRRMNRIAPDLKLRGWCHYLHWYCDAASWTPRHDEHVRPITEAQSELWQQWLSWPGPMVGPKLHDQFEIADAFGYVLEGKLVSAAQVEASSKDFAWEYGIDTRPEFRGRGFATAVVNSVTSFIMEQGRIPWHYHDHYNKASMRLPEKAGFFRYCEGLFSAV